MRPWTLEHGSLWAIDAKDRLPPPCLARVQAEFAEVRGNELGELASAMNLLSPDLIQRRLQSNRRCFSMRTAGQIAAYGWVTRGAECVGELERQFQLYADEAYIWDCGTVPTWRDQHFYSALLSQLIRELFREGARRIWIGASLHNYASTRGIANAGFNPVVSLTYCRVYRLTLLRIYPAAEARDSLVAAAYRILLNAHERRFGPLVLGYRL